ncbi:carbonic anhydrase [Suillus fuscotomentosus]|uniref:Carbonic anhydrase n=1 Tax=Suillus fuscotomentosus TaxID=1912939 RepID=A0AAD4E2S6_9AGAM|nr:carbonic anhydrase [Suillus fuscotomentosus]KAG1898552.1 carbonic anhydrase [Suillus fuscotomentosus]
MPVRNELWASNGGSLQIGLVRAMMCWRVRPIQTLLNANEEWAQSVVRDIPDFFASHLPESQGISFEVWIGCSDSRVPESIITASEPGDIFVHRNVANQFHLHDDSALSVLSFAVKEVGVEHGEFLITLMMRSILSLMSTRLQQSFSSVTPTVEALNKVVKANIIKQVDNICKSEPNTTAWADPHVKKVTVYGWIYDLAEGRIKELVHNPQGFAPNSWFSMHSLLDFLEVALHVEGAQCIDFGTAPSELNDCDLIAEYRDQIMAKIRRCLE